MRKCRFPLSFFIKMLMSAFLLGFKANYLEKMHGHPISLCGFNSTCKDLLFTRGPNLAQKPLYLVGTVLKLVFKTSVCFGCLACVGAFGCPLSKHFSVVHPVVIFCAGDVSLLKFRNILKDTESRRKLPFL